MKKIWILTGVPVAMVLATVLAAASAYFLVSAILSTSKVDIIPVEPQIKKWVDPANDVIIYIAPEGYQIVAIPAYVTIPPMYAQYALDLYVLQNQKLPPLSNYPDEWLEALKVYGKIPVGSLDKDLH